jgi:REP element-mobilizing transposase RayT
MQFIAGKVYHVYNRGNNSQCIYLSKANYLYFLSKVQKMLIPDCDILAYCLMPNHFHFLIQPNEEGCIIPQTSKGDKIQSLSRNIGVLQSSYTRAIQKQEGIKGSLFQQKTKAKMLEPSKWPGKNTVATCLHYIHQNPLKAGLVTKLEDWEYSSFQDFAQIRNGKLCNIELAVNLAEIDLLTFRNDSYGVMRDEIIEKVIF